jgi:hypothetical protein
MRYSLVEDDVTVANARSLREMDFERELPIEASIAWQIRLRSSSATTLNAQVAEAAPLNRRRSLRKREQRSTRRKARVNYQS